MTTLADRPATDHGVVREAPRWQPCTWEKALASFVRPGWSVRRSGSALSGVTACGVDAVVFDDSPRAEDLLLAADALAPLGRIVTLNTWPDANALERRLSEDGALGLAVTSRLVLEDGRRVTVIEKCGDAGAEPRRRGAHPGAYKMSRYKAYHQMQSAVARLIPTDVRDVIEIGDSNGVIRAMLGGVSGREPEYFRAHYPPHDLQTLTQIPDASRDVFICDNTLEHVADPHAAVRQMTRVLRPGGWLVLFAPFIAMCQDDDRCRWSTRALSELLAPHFDSGMLGAWGNVEACCWYMRANKWLRVIGDHGGVLRCRDSRLEATPIVEVPSNHDRLHPIHVWAVARRGGTDLPKALVDTPLARWGGLPLAAKEPTAALARSLSPGASVLVAAASPGHLADRLAELGLRPTCFASDAWGATEALSRGFACTDSPEDAGAFDAAVFDLSDDPHAINRVRFWTATARAGVRMLLLGDDAGVAAAGARSAGFRNEADGVFIR